MKTKLQHFHDLRTDIWFHKSYDKLTKAEVAECEAFLRENEQLSHDDFSFKANRWGLDEGFSWERRKRRARQWDLVTTASIRHNKQKEASNGAHKAR